MLQGGVQVLRAQGAVLRSAVKLVQHEVLNLFSTLNYEIKVLY